MVFSSLIFLGLFLPVTFALYCLTPPKLRNVVLILASLIFYIWGEFHFVLLMLALIGANFCFGVALDRVRHRLWLLWIAVALNLCVLGVFKYGNFAVETWNQLAAPLGKTPVAMAHIALPLGISFYTFHAISYLIDIYRRNAEPNRNPIEYGLYILFFPQLIAGPIVRYKDINHQLRSRSLTLDNVSAGIFRFTMGLAKKVLIANPLGVIADTGFSAAPGDIGTAFAWFALVCYTLQIYFDFSGYSDMAIGLARMFGFKFPENFNYPYSAQSLQDFWRRWHISLSTWFRDYVYIPLGGNRLGATRTYVNLWGVFLLTGLWHGASWNFVIWGALHGAYLTIERVTGRDATRQTGWRGVMHLAYTVFAVMIAWVFFRAHTLADATHYLSTMAGLNTPSLEGITIGSVYTPQLGITMLVAVALSLGLYPKLRHLARPVTQGLADVSVDGYVRVAFVLPMLVLCLMSVGLGQYNPFIYFRF